MSTGDLAYAGPFMSKLAGLLQAAEEVLAEGTCRKVLLAPTELRSELFKCHFEENLFNLAEQADANECF